MRRGASQGQCAARRTAHHGTCTRPTIRRNSRGPGGTSGAATCFIWSRTRLSFRPLRRDV
eukprot:7818833-Karenia_brevis.AAC.1